MGRRETCGETLQPPGRQGLGRGGAGPTEWMGRQKWTFQRHLGGRVSKAWRPTEQEEEELGYLKVGGGCGQVSTGVKAVSLPGTQGIPGLARQPLPPLQFTLQLCLGC